MGSKKAKSADKGRGRKAGSDSAGHNSSRKFDFFGAVMPSDDFADYHEARYILNLMDQTSRKHREAYALMAAVEYNYGHLPDFPFQGEPDEEDPSRRTFRYTMSGNLGKVKAKDWQAIQKFMKTRMDRAVSDAPIEEKTPERLEALFILLDHLGLDEDVKEICEFLHIYHTEMTFQKFYNDLCEANNRGGQAAAYFLGKPEKVDKFKKLLNRNGKLDDFGLIENKSFGETFQDSLLLPHLDPNVLYKIIGLTDPNDILERIVGKTVTTDLDKDDFDNLSDEIDGIVDEIKAAAKAGEKGVTILLIGEEGVGKTELAKVLAKRAGKRLVSVSEDSDEATEEFDEDGNLVSTITYDTQEVRKADLKQANKLFEGNKDVILFFDEAEDLMPPSQDSEKSSDPNNKIATNRLIEENPVVTIMAVNDPRKFHRSFLDRFQAKLFVDTPPTLARQSIWKSQAEKAGVKLSDEDTLYLARNYEIAPRKIVMPLKAAARQPGKDALKVIENRLAGNAVNVSRIKAANPIPRNFATDLYEVEGPDTVDDKTWHLIDLAKRNYPFSLFMTVGEGMEEEALLTYIAEQAKLNIDIVEADELMVETAFSNPFSNISNLFTSASNYKRMVGITNIHALAEYAGNQKEWQESPIVQHFMREASRHNQPFAIVGSRKFADDVASAKFRAMFSESMTLTDIDTARLPSIYQRVLGVPLPDGIAFSEQDETKIRLSDLYAAKTLMGRMADAQDPRHVYDLVMRQKQAREKTAAGQIGFSAQPS